MLNYAALRRYLIFIPLALMGDGMFNTIIVRSETNREDFKLLVSPYAALLGSFLANFMPNFITFSFTVILWVCGHLFESLNQSIQSCLGQRSSDFLSIKSIGIYPQAHAYELAKLRQTHENLCDAVRFLGKAFGFQVQP